MDYQLNMNKSSSSPKPKNHFFHGQKQPYEEELAEHSTLSTPTTLSSTYLTADSPWKHPTTVDCLKLDDEHKRQTMELKTVGKMGMVRRKQFLQKRDFSRSHEVSS
ncbi:unnamed protein product [Adineta ricciae]|uniref:Uncharacterized protein n=1 Tax=Adineta ricciae TaxID=249248 RepID=A0A814PGJ4_ADIRI|nr:unnamed protein product [Adineta ricciae]CAF1667178.1 unnamed protein product [Adineta ricciae]